MKSCMSKMNSHRAVPAFTAIENHSSSSSFYNCAWKLVQDENSFRVSKKERNSGLAFVMRVLTVFDF